MATKIEELTELLRKEARRVRRWLGALRDAVNDIASVTLAGFFVVRHGLAAAKEPSAIRNQKSAVSSHRRPTSEG